MSGQFPPNKHYFAMWHRLCYLQPDWLDYNVWGRALTKLKEPFSKRLLRRIRRIKQQLNKLSVFVQFVWTHHSGCHFPGTYKTLTTNNTNSGSANRSEQTNMRDSGQHDVTSPGIPTRQCCRSNKSHWTSWMSQNECHWTSWMSQKLVSLNIWMSQN